MREVVIRDYLVEQVILRDGLCELHIAPGQRGVPDCIVTWPCRHIDFVETKTLGGVLSSAQKRDHARRLKRGIRVRVLWTKTQVDEYVRLHDHGIDRI
jgi:hypothetical protein